MDKYTQLENRIAELEKWKADRMRQQLVFPLDEQSLNVIREFFMYITTAVEYDAGVGSNHFKTYFGKQGTKKVTNSSYPDSTLGAEIDFEIGPISLVTYTVNVSTNYVTTQQVSGNVKFFDGTEVVLISEGTAPAPLSTGLGTSYFVRDSDGYEFKLAATLGGAAIDITDVGSGRQFISAV